MSYDLPDAEIVAAREAGATLDSLATRHGVSAQTIRRRLDAAGHTERAPGSKRTAVPLSALIDAYQDGVSLKSIARMAGVSPETIGRRLREAGVTIRTRGVTTPAAKQRMVETARQRRPVSIGEIRELQGQGLTVLDMTDELGATEAAILAAIARADMLQ